LTESSVVLDHAHHEAHDGSAFTISHSGTENSAANINVTLTTPNSTNEMHLVASVFGSGQATFEIGEVVTASTGGAIVPYNHNRNSANTSGAVAPLSDDNITDMGTIIYTTVIGAGQTQEGDDRGAHEWVLKRNTKYAFRLTSNAASNRLRLNLIWYEHIDRT
jgi:hypothetical protein